MPTISLDNFSLEKMVRGAVRVDSFVTERLPPEPEKPVPTPGAIWGGPSQFKWDTSSGSTIDGLNWGVVLTDEKGPDNEEGQSPPSQAVAVFSETERETEDVRIENPDDSSQYVIVQRIQTIRFEAPANLGALMVSMAEGRISSLSIEFKLNHPQDTP